jgi:thiol-disulfide isomerase/thioredoxin
MRNSVVAVAGVVLMGLAFGWGVAQYRRNVAASAEPAAATEAAGGERATLRFFKNPSPAPDFTLTDLSGGHISPRSFAGKVVILNFWATWCGPCRAEIPDLVALQEKYRDQLQIIGISEDESPPETVKRFAASLNVNYPVAMVTPEVEKLYPGIAALPTSFFIDRKGQIVQRHVGMLDRRRTELETRSLAGLPVDVDIVREDDANKTMIENAAQAKEIPGIDLASLPVEKKTAALQKLNADNCTCGCGLTLAACRINDPTCGVSLPLARAVVKQIAEAR